MAVSSSRRVLTRLGPRCGRVVVETCHNTSRGESGAGEGRKHPPTRVWSEGGCGMGLSSSRRVVTRLRGRGREETPSDSRFERGRKHPPTRVSSEGGCGGGQ